MREISVLVLGAANSIHTVRWVNALSDNGVRVNLGYCPGHAPCPSTIKPSVGLYRLPVAAPIGYWLNAPFVRALGRKLGAQIIHGYYASGYGTLLRWSRPELGVVSVWGSDVYLFPEGSKLRRALIRKNLRYPKLVCSTTRAMAERTGELAAPTEQPIAVVPFGVDTGFFRRESEYLATSRVVRFGILKSLTRNYGVDVVVRAFHTARGLLEEQGLDSSLQIAGDGPERESLERLVHDLNEESNVSFLGSVSHSQVPSFLEGLTIFLQGSYSESFGVAALEAASMGIPVIATDAVGFDEVLEQGRLGVLTPRGDAEAMAEAMVSLALDGTERLRLSKEGRAAVEQKYEFDANVRDMVGLYRRILASM